jgi:hypothetical protein
LTLSVVGLILGAAFAWWGVAALVAVLPSYFPRLADIVVDGRVLMVSAGLALASGLASGIAPVIHSARSIDQTLRQGGRASSSDVGRNRLRGMLLVTQVALAVVLLIGAALFLTSFSRVMRIDLGVDYKDVMTVEVRPSTGEGPAAADSLSRLADSVRTIPGVQAASLVTENRPFRLSSSQVHASVPGRQDRYLDRGRRHLRCHGLHRQPSHTRDRDPPRAWVARPPTSCDRLSDGPRCRSAQVCSSVWPSHGSSPILCKPSCLT